MISDLCKIEKESLILDRKKVEGQISVKKNPSFLHAFTMCEEKPQFFSRIFVA